jgi:hypothetical protein
MIRWAREVISLLREINARLERIEKNQASILRNRNGRNFIATGPHNS